MTHCSDCANGKPIGGRMVYCTKHGEMQPELYCCEYWKSRVYPTVSLAKFLEPILASIPKCDIFIQTSGRCYELERSDRLFYSKQWEEVRHLAVENMSIRYDPDLHHYILHVTVV